MSKPGSDRDAAQRRERAAKYLRAVRKFNIRLPESAASYVRADRDSH